MRNKSNQFRFVCLLSLSRRPVFPTFFHLQSNQKPFHLPVRPSSLCPLSDDDDDFLSSSESRRFVGSQTIRCFFFSSLQLNCHRHCQESRMWMSDWIRIRFWDDTFLSLSVQITSTSRLYISFSVQHYTSTEELDNRVSYRKWTIVVFTKDSLFEHFFTLRLVLERAWRMLYISWGGSDRSYYVYLTTSVTTKYLSSFRSVR